MTPALRLLLAGLVVLGGCVRRPPAPADAVHYVVGAGYKAGNTWFYPREDFHYDATGLATIADDARGVTADGEVRDPTAMTAAHQTLQLPAILRVTNLETGLQALVRVNDRGPASPGRILSASASPRSRRSAPPRSAPSRPHRPCV